MNCLTSLIDCYELFDRLIQDLINVLIVNAILIKILS